MPATAQQVIFYEDVDGRVPFAEWYKGLPDSRAVKRVLTRIARLRTGNFGDHRPVGGSVLELRVDYGPGYRLYCARDGQTVVILLCGGDKRTQPADIQMAQRYWQRYKEAK